MSNTKNNQIIILGGSAVAIILIFLLGIAIGAKSRGTYQSPSNNQIIADLQQKLDSKAQKGLIPIMIGRGSAANSQLKNNLTGQIETAAGNILAIRFDNRYDSGNIFAYLDEPDYFVKKFRINKDTKIIAKQRKDPEIVRKEMEDYLAKMKAAKEKNNTNSDLILPLSSYTEKEITINDLKVGTSATVETVSGFNIKDNSEAIVAKITVEM